MYVFSSLPYSPRLPHLSCPSYNPRMILCQSPLGWTNRPIREADAQELPQINTLRPAYTVCTSIRRSTIVVVLACSCPRIFRVLDQTIVKPRDCSVRRPHTSHLSLRDLSNGCASQQCQHPPLHHVHIPSSTREFVVAVALARTARTPRRRLGIDGHMQPFAYRDEGLVVQMVFCLPVRPLANGQLTDFSRRR